MKVPGSFQIALAAILVALASCSREDANRKSTYPVTGELYVDGKPAASVLVTLHDLAGVDESQPTFSTTFTGDDGRFSLSTYEEGDGVPEGEYAVTFFWGELNPISLQYGGEDKLTGRYNDPKNPPVKVKVEAGKPTDLKRIELTTSGS
jgi:hypothetical protein